MVGGPRRIPSSADEPRRAVVAIVCCPTEPWRLDDFEGPGYERILATAQTANGPVERDTSTPTAHQMTEDGPAGRPALTPDGHHVIIKGRQWRATDPEIPDDAAAVLRRELMSARRAVGAALRASDHVAETTARDRVQAVKVALGERGTPWWEQTSAERQDRWLDLVKSLDS